ncbi:MAG: hypothetical protein FJ267_09715 [Planctomycetes bacterium]|nr:hypothetical protein [Planctomycetota bacterium]
MRDLLTNSFNDSPSIKSSRRQLLSSGIGIGLSIGQTWTRLLAQASPSSVVSSNDKSRRFFFTSQGKTGIGRTDGQAVQYMEFNAPGQATWQPGSVFPDGRRVIVLTSGQSMWFAASYGNLKSRGGGSNVPSWTADGKILFPHRTEGARVPWQYRVNQTDVDHFNRDYRPDQARGGSQICELDPRNGSLKLLTTVQESVWDFRSSSSSDGKQIVFCRAATGETPSIWTMDRDGKNARKITQGIDDLGADHPRWI